GHLLCGLPQAARSRARRALRRPARTARPLARADPPGGRGQAGRAPSTSRPRNVRPGEPRCPGPDPMDSARSRLALQGRRDARDRGARAGDRVCDREAAVTWAGPAPYLEAAMAAAGVAWAGPAPCGDLWRRGEGCDGLNGFVEIAVAGGAFFIDDRDGKFAGL